MERWTPDIAKEKIAKAQANWARIPEYLEDSDYFGALNDFQYGFSRLIEHALMHAKVSKEERSLLEEVLRDTWVHSSVRRKMWDKDATQFYRKKLTKMYEAVCEIYRRYEQEYATLSQRQVRFAHGKYTVLNQASFTDEEVAQLLGYLDEATKLLTDAGYGFLCYGGIRLVSNTGRDKHCAWYTPWEDAVTMRLDTGDKNPVRTICHELGHRLWSKLHANQIDKTHYESLYKRNLKAIIKENSKFQTPGGAIIHVVERHQSPHQKRSTRWKIFFVAPGNTDGKICYPSSRWLLNALRSKNFVTNYAMTNAEENFCELFSFYIPGKLPEHFAADFEKGLIRVLPQEQVEAFG